jgi:hypothetical protein
LKMFVVFFILKMDINIRCQFSLQNSLMLARSLAFLDILALVVCSVCLVTFGPETPFVARIYVLEGFFSLIGFSIILLGLETILGLVLGQSNHAYAKFLESRQMFKAFVVNNCVFKGVTKEGDTILQLPAEVFKSVVSGETKDDAGAPAISNESVSPNELVSSSSSQNGTQTSMDEIKGSTMSDDGCSAATTA